MRRQPLKCTYRHRQALEKPLTSTGKRCHALTPTPNRSQPLIRTSSHRLPRKATDNRQLPLTPAQRNSKTLTTANKPRQALPAAELHWGPRTDNGKYFVTTSTTTYNHGQPLTFTNSDNHSQRLTFTRKRCAPLNSTAHHGHALTSLTATNNIVPPLRRTDMHLPPVISADNPSTIETH